MAGIGLGSTEEQLYDWLVRYLSDTNVSARATGQGVIEVVVDHEGPRTVQVLIGRRELRNNAWAAYDVGDDRVLDDIPLSEDPVRAGLAGLALSLDEALASLRSDETHLVFDHGEFRGSTRPGPPAVPSTRDPVGPPGDSTRPAATGTHAAAAGSSRTCARRTTPSPPR